MKKQDTWLKDKSIELLKVALSNCNPEILYNPKNVVIHVPKYFYDFIGAAKNLKFMGYPVQIGYQDEIVIFDKENGFMHNRIFKYKI